MRRLGIEKRVEPRQKELLVPVLEDELFLQPRRHGPVCRGHGPVIIQAQEEDDDGRDNESGRAQKPVTSKESRA